MILKQPYSIRHQIFLNPFFFSSSITKENNTIIIVSRNYGHSYSENTRHMNRKYGRRCISTYDRLEIERRWIDKISNLHTQKKQLKIDNAPNMSCSFDGDKQKEKLEKYYCLTMFPYPSGTLHMGHLRVYTIGDVVARYKRMKGYQVIHPFGWDSFGLPAENAALQHGIPAEQWTEMNIEKMREQVKRMGVSVDWDRELKTSDPVYYKFTQYLFLKLFEHGLVYMKDAQVNWDPVDKTVLANEQVNKEGRAERSGALVEKKKLIQWFIKTTSMAEDLFTGLKDLDWPSQVKNAQKQWIGKTSGYEISMRLFYRPELHILHKDENLSTIQVFTKSLDNIVQISSIKISSDHHLASKVNQIKDGIKAINPFNNKLLPIEVLEDELELDYQDTAIFVYSDSDSSKKSSETFDTQEIIANLLQSNIIKQESRYRLRDWLISRQRYWGTPIPIIHCPDCGPVPVKEEDLPIKLSSKQQISNDLICKCPKCSRSDAKRETDTMDTFFDSSWYWYRYLDPKNKSEFLNPALAQHNLPVDIYIGGVEHAIMHLLYARFMSKFISKFLLSNVGLLESGHGGGEPFLKLVTQGMVQGITYRSPKTGRYLKKEELEFYSKDMKSVTIKSSGESPMVKHEKMSKSKFNGVDPLIVLNEFGADATRLCILYKAPPEDDVVWDDHGILGMDRWLSRTWRLVSQHSEAKSNLQERILALDQETDKFIQMVTKVLESSLHMNVAIAHLIKFSYSIQSHLSSLSSVSSSTTNKSIQDALIALSQMMYPFSPCLSIELLTRLLGKEIDSSDLIWPTLNRVHKSKSLDDDQDTSLASEDKLGKGKRTVKIVVNGKQRGKINVSMDELMDDQRLLNICLSQSFGDRWLLSPETRQPFKVKKVIRSKKLDIVSLVLDK